MNKKKKTTTTSFLSWDTPLHGIFILPGTSNVEVVVVVGIMPFNPKANSLLNIKVVVPFRY